MNAASRSDAALDLVERLRRGETSAVEAMRHYLRRIEEREKDVRAFAYLAPEAAMAAAEKADAAKASGLALGPLHGLPVAVKDIIDTADMPTEFGGEIFAGRRPKRDATIVQRLRSAGAIVVGKAVTSQYALFVPGPVRNPHDLARTPGGSSSGSAAAVAAGFVPVALGTQTNGSIVRADRVLICDRENDRVQAFDRAGRWLMDWRGLCRPMDLLERDDGVILVSDQVPSLTAFAPDGERLGRARPSLNGSHGVALAPDGAIYLAEIDPSSVTKLNPV